MEALKVTQTEFYPRDNASSNHTEEFVLTKDLDSPTPIFRRGSTFYFALRFDRSFDEKLDVVRIAFNFGPKPTVMKGTKIILPLLIKVKQLPEDKRNWGVCVTDRKDNIVTLMVQIGVNAQVGIWNCSIQTNTAGERNRRDYKDPIDIYILFNPWCKHDGVYLPNEDDLNEYILNESGKVWCGGFKDPKGKSWIYGQFEDICLPAAVFLLDKSGLNPQDRGSPILVSRALSAVINSVDDGGLLEGRWDGEYEDGTSPHAWTGSVAIMDEYFNNGGRPVKYGQCWVFAAATVTVCRALGIPCRPVTNYVSAHDTNCSLTVDKYFDKNGNRIEYGPDGESNDSCWNFHVWNDVWMTRPDLPPGYGGWQIIDATPQEQSGKLYRCGPAPIEAVKKGEVGFLYDTPFAFSEVNADIVHFQEDESSDWGFSRLSINQYHVGRKIVTKKVGVSDDRGNSDMWEVTHLYKNPEGTEAERLAVYNAIKAVPHSYQFYDIPKAIANDVSFSLIDYDVIPFGESFDVVVNIKNHSDELRNISAVLTASSVFYTGATAHSIKKAQGSFSVKGGQNETLKIHVTANEYLNKLVDHSLIKIYAIANVKETKQTWSEEDDFSLVKPTLKLVILSENCKIGNECRVELSFKNPMDTPLTDCSYTVEGPGVAKAKVVAFRDVQPKETVQVTENFLANRTGTRQVVARFNSKQIQGIEGSIKITVNE